jgi:hypothetical protein
MNPGLILYIVIAAVVYLFIVVVCAQTIRNPRAAWERLYGRHTQGGEPAEGALDRLRRWAVVSVVVTPVILVVGGFVAQLTTRPAREAIQRKRHEEQAIAEKTLGFWGTTAEREATLVELYAASGAHIRILRLTSTNRRADSGPDE